MRKAEAGPGKTILINGLSGTLGLGATLCALGRGVTRILGTARDKKRVGEGAVPFVLLDAPGSPKSGCAVPSKALISAVRELSG